MINMETKAFVRLLLLFLGFSYLLLPCAAVPTTRSLKSNKELPSSVQDLLDQDVMKLSEGEELLGEADGFNGERLLMESTDYPGTGANKNHDPKTPGRA
ncbi:Cyclin/Brf1-like TBP-binding protein, putative isoform 1 [Hibiscus syriacus]|uniref:Cyclin/Brf1-like TBP-binding protein, putative isoform 1 n=1 Tax=Hibiscus syriacus TaxID=106335 RepID=A0A6A3DA10_HIBSY|nr:Cyclin/Brf1-like TBP-binding protein, putative isoform 1 [Hibiscus syriacus]